MKMSVNRILAAVLSVITASVMLTGCSNHEGSTAQSSEPETSASASSAPETASSPADTTESASEKETVTTATDTEPEDPGTASSSLTTSEKTVLYPDGYFFMMSGYVSTRKSNLMMRVRPDENAPTVFSEGIERGKPVEVYGSGKGSDGAMWYFVKYNGYEGWCKASYITKEAPESIQTETTKSGKVKTDYVKPEHYLEYGNHCQTVVGELNLRSGPGESYQSYLKLPKGTQLEELGYNDDGEWIFTCYNGQYGWVKTSHNGKIYIEFYGGMAKPVIYLYPETDTVVNVNLDLHTSELSTTYPNYGTGWKVLAKTDGSLLNLADGTHHSCLFWDSRNDRTHYDFSEGFCVRGADTEAFLKEKLSDLGLTEPEMNEFIMYWLPRMEHNSYNLISFQQDAYTEAAKLTVSPQPDSMLRVFMAYVPLEHEIVISPQTLKPFERSGFTVVEWGGTVYGVMKAD